MHRDIEENDSPPPTSPQLLNGVPSTLAMVAMTYHKAKDEGNVSRRGMKEKSFQSLKHHPAVSIDISKPAVLAMLDHPSKIIMSLSICICLAMVGEIDL